MLVFISHNKADKSVAREVALFLSSENVSVWFDEWEISAGDSITQEVNSGLHNCTHFIVLWSENSAKSNWVRKELYSILSKAIQSGVPRVLPILLDETPLPDLLSDILYIRYDDGTEEDRKKIVRAVLGSNPSLEFNKAIVKKYHEVVFDPEAGDPFGLKVCPSCGSTNLKITYINDNHYDELWFFIECGDCNWGDASQ